jgi:hypothetical protein
LKKLKIILLSLIALYVLSGLIVYLFQEKFIFLDGSIPADYQFDLKSNYEEINLKADDGANLNAIHFKTENSKGVILYFHGNGGDLRRWAKVTEYYVGLDYDVIVMDYRGYGKSTGKRTEVKLMSDAAMFYDYALNHYREDEITLYGRSLGTGIASYLASRRDSKQLILETPYYDFKSVAQRYYPIFPVGLALRFNFKSHIYLKDAKCPIYIFHGTEDEVVPYASAKKLYKSIPAGQARFFSIEGGKHKNLIDFEPFIKGIEGILE